MGLGQAYLSFQTFGLSIAGFIILAGGGLVALFAEDISWKIGGAVIGLVGLGLMLSAGMIRDEVSDNESFEGVGIIILGMAVLGWLGTSIKEWVTPDEPESNEEDTDGEDANSSNGDITSGVNVVSQEVEPTTDNGTNV